MKVLNRAMLCSALVMAVAAAPASAQGDGKNVVSANPFGLLIGWFNVEYERVISESATAGVGGSIAELDDWKYNNADLFARYYPQGDPFNGWAFGAKIGLTAVDDGNTYFGYGFDANRSWLLGKNNNFYVGIGFGLKRLVGVEDQEDGVMQPGDEATFQSEYIPTFRLVNIGFRF